MYYDYFGLKEAPFSIAPNPEYLFMTARHQEALAHLYHGIKSDAGFVLLTGDVGTGKTTICRCFLSELPDNVAVAYILNPFLGGRELLMTICEELDIKNIDRKSSLRSLTQHIHKRLLENHSKGLTTILLIDEAQHINLKVLELIRLLTNLETNKQKLFKIILVGQPELNQHIEKPELIQLAQRITARYHIKSLNPDEMSAYINYRLNIAGSIDGVNIFPPAIINMLYKMTEGVPRVINALCDRALLGVYSQNERQVNKKTLKVAYAEIKGKEMKAATFVSGHWLALASLLVFVALGSWFLSQQYYSGQDRSIEFSASQEEPVLENIDENNINLVEPQSKISNIPPEFIYTDIDSALDQLIRGLYIPTTGGFSTCDEIAFLDWHCERENINDWDTLLTINRPVVIAVLYNSDIFYIPIVAKRGQQFGFLQNGVLSWADIASIQPLWEQATVFLWQPPEQFADYIYFDSSPRLINWLANAFSIIDEQSQSLANDDFNSLLKRRVALFQRNNALTVDGIAGRDTVLRINEVLGIAKVLENNQSQDTSAIATPNIDSDSAESPLIQLENR